MERTLGEVACRAFLASGESWQAVADAVVAAHEARRWRPISEAHEDFGQCVFINMEDADTPVCASTLDTDYAENCEWYGWTHFAPIILTTETAERLMSSIPAPPHEVERGA
jgi:hypothetical protein